MSVFLKMDLHLPRLLQLQQEQEGRTPSPEITVRAGPDVPGDQGRAGRRRGRGLEANRGEQAVLEGAQPRARVSGPNQGPAAQRRRLALQ